MWGVTTLGGVKDGRTGRYYVRRSGESKNIDFERMSGSTFASRRRTGKLGFVENTAPLKTGADNSKGKAPGGSGSSGLEGLVSQLASSGLGKRYKRPKTAPILPPMEQDEDENAMEEDEMEPVLAALPEMNNFAKMAKEKEERERSQREAQVGVRLKVFGDSLDQVYRSLVGVGDWMDRSLKIKLIRGKTLPICDARKSDPYVKFRLNDQTKLSSVMRSNLNPVWNENFAFKIKGGLNTENILSIDLYDQDLLPADFNDDGDDYIGGFKICIENDLELDVPLRRWYKLEGGDLKDIKGQKQIQMGEVQLELFYTVATGNQQSNIQSLRPGSRGAASLSSGFASSKSAGSSPMVSQQIKNTDDVSRMTDDSKRMVLVGHVGRLRHASPDVRRMAVQALAKTAGRQGVNLPKNGDWRSQIIKSLTERILKDPQSEVRLDALEALVMTTRRGEPEAIKTTAAALKDQSRDVRHAAVLAMAPLATSGDETAIFSMAERLEDSDYKVRESAGLALSKLSTEHDQRLVKQVLMRLQSIHSVVRKNAVRTLVTVSTPGSLDVLDGLMKALEDPDPHVRVAAMQSLVSQVEKGNDTMLMLVLKQLDDGVADVRAAAADCLSQISLLGDRQVIAALSGKLNDNDKDLYGHLTVRTAALKAIASLAKDGDGAPTSPRTKNTALKGAIESLGESDWWVRVAAADALAALSRIGGGELGGEVYDQVIERLVSMLADPVPNVRQKAYKTLETLAKPSDNWFNAALAMKLMSSESDVRSIAATMLQSHLVAKLKSEGVRIGSNRIMPLASPSKSGTEHILSHQRSIKDFENFARVKKGASEKYFLESSGKESKESPLSSPRRIVHFSQNRKDGGDSSGGSPQSPVASPKGRKEPLRFSLIDDEFAKTPMPRGKVMSRGMSSSRSLGGGLGSPTGSSMLGSPMPDLFASSGGQSPMNRSLSPGNRSLSPEERDGESNSGRPAWIWVVRFLRKVKHGRKCSAEKALEILENTTPRGDERAIEGLLWSMNSPDEPVRAISIEGLRRISLPGQAVAVKELERRLGHPRWEFRRDAALALSLIASKDDQDTVKKLMGLLDDEQREVRAAVEQATKNLLYPGDDRIVIAGSCVQLEHQFHAKEERQEALETLGNLAYRSTHIKLMGYSVENSEMEAFWKRLRMPKEPTSDTQDLLPKILNLFADDDAWVRRAAVRASVQCCKKADQTVANALLELLDDPNFTVRVVAVHALASLNKPGDQHLINSLLRKQDDHSHLVRLAAIQALGSIVLVGDRRTGHRLLDWLRVSWMFRKARGDDFEVKKEVAKVVINAMGLSHKSAECIQFSQGLLHKSLHAQRNTVSRFTDHLVQHGLIEPQQLTRHFNSQASVRSYGPAHKLAAIRIQRWLRSRSLIHSSSRFKGQSKRGRDRYKKPTAGGGLGGRSKASRKKALLWFMVEEDEAAEKVVKNKVPEQIRNNAISTAHEKALAGLDDMDLWERMRWTERLRLCEEIAGHPW